MQKHTWQKNTCTECGITKATKTVKTRIAIGFDGKDHYRYETKVIYILKSGAQTFVRPECTNTARPVIKKKL